MDILKNCTRQGMLNMESYGSWLLQHTVKHGRNQEAWATEAGVQPSHHPAPIRVVPARPWPALLRYRRARASPAKRSQDNLAQARQMARGRLSPNNRETSPDHCGATGHPGLEFPWSDYVIISGGT